MSAGRILVVDDDETFRLTTAALLSEDGHFVTTVGSGQEAVEAVRRSSFDLMLLDLRMPGADGLMIVEALRRWGQGIPILMISGFGTVDSAVSALHRGADDFLMKPVEPSVLSDRVAALLERRPHPSEAAAPPTGLVGRTEAMGLVADAIGRVAPTDATVLVTGETGTGKELVARAVHDMSPRAKRPFVAVNCGALVEPLLESELFGHVRGAFTGAVRDKVGLFESAAGGTLFLDEIGDVSAAVQQRLLRVLQQREVTPVGSVNARPVDVRIVAATNRDLRADIAAGRFREDLFYRLHVFRIALPPLRERRADIPLLVEHVLAMRGDDRDASAPAPSCSPLAMHLLQTYHWPGNVRELMTAIEGALIRADDCRIEAHHLPPEVRAAAPDLEDEARYRAQADAVSEREAIVSALDNARGMRARAADLLGMSRTTLWRKLRKYGLTSDGPDDDQ